MEINISFPGANTFGEEELADLLHRLNMLGKGPLMSHYFPEGGDSFNNIGKAMFGDKEGMPHPIEVLQTETDGSDDDMHYIHVCAVFLSDGTARVFSEPNGFLIDFARRQGGDNMLSLAERGGESESHTWFEAIAAVARSYANLITTISTDDEKSLNQLASLVSNIRASTGNVTVS